MAGGLTKRIVSLYSWAIAANQRGSGRPLALTRPRAPSDQRASIIEAKRAAGSPGAPRRGFHFDPYLSDAVAGVPPVVGGSRRRLGDAVARPGDPLVAGDLEADLTLAYLEPLDEVVVDVPSGYRGARLQPEVHLDPAPVLVSGEEVGDLAGGRVVEPTPDPQLGCGRGGTVSGHGPHTRAPACR